MADITNFGAELAVQSWGSAGDGNTVSLDVRFFVELNDGRFVIDPMMQSMASGNQAPTTVEDLGFGIHLGMEMGGAQPLQRLIEQLRLQGIETDHRTLADRYPMELRPSIHAREQLGLPSGTLVYSPG